MTAELWPDNDPTVHPFGDVLCPAPNPNYDGPHIMSPAYRRGTSLAWFRSCCCGAVTVDPFPTVPGGAVAGPVGVPACDATGNGSATGGAL